MTDCIPILKRVVENYIVERMPKTVNGYSIEWCTELVDMSEHVDDAPEGCVCVMLRAWAYYKTEDRCDVDTSGHVVRGFHYYKDWLNGEFDPERMSYSAYIFSKVPKETMEYIRDTMQGFVSDVVQFCVDLERWK